MRVAGETNGKQGIEVQYVRSVTMVTRWIHELFEEDAENALGGNGVADPDPNPVPPQ